MKKEVLITGHTGFIGRALMAALQSDEALHVCGVSRSTGCNLFDADSIGRLTPFDAVVHLAGFVGVARSWKNPAEALRGNILPTLNVLELSRARKSHIIFMSSYLYGTPDYLPIDERHPVRCFNPYAQSKHLAEFLCEGYARDFGIPVTIIRLFNVYGPGQTDESLIPYVVNQVLHSDKVAVKDLRPKRDYLYIDDVVDALARVIRSDAKGLRIFNLGAGSSSSVEEVIQVAMKEARRSIPIECSSEQRPNEVLDCYSDSSKFCAAFDWKPRVGLAKGIAKMLTLSSRVG